MVIAEAAAVARQSGALFADVIFREAGAAKVVAALLRLRIDGGAECDRAGIVDRIDRPEYLRAKAGDPGASIAGTIQDKRRRIVPLPMIDQGNGRQPGRCPDDGAPCSLA